MNDSAGLVTHYVDHIWKKTTFCSRCPTKVLSKQPGAELCEQCDSIEAELGAGKHQQLEQLSARLEPPW